MTTAGIYAAALAEVYHRDDVAATPTLSASIANLLCRESPLHAWTAHPKLNPDFERKDEDKFDLGTVVHQVFLEGQSAVELIDAKDYRTDAAKAAKAAARTAGMIPMLAKEWPAVVDMVTTVRERLLAHQADPPLFRDGRPEVTIVWEEPGGVWCRSRLDWLRDDGHYVDDLKTTSRSANPRTLARTIFGLGYDLKAEFYCRGVERITGVRPEFRLAFVETTPPYAVSVLSLAPSAQIIARKKAEYAIDLWRRCLDRDEWPGFTDRVAHVEVPGWEESAWLEQELEAVA